MRRVRVRRRVVSSVGLLALAASPAFAADPSPAASPDREWQPRRGVPLEGTTWQLTNRGCRAPTLPFPLGALTTLTLKDGHASGVGRLQPVVRGHTRSTASADVRRPSTSTLDAVRGRRRHGRDLLLRRPAGGRTWAIEGTT